MKNNRYEKDDNKDEEYFQIINSKIYEEKRFWTIIQKIDIII